MDSFARELQRRLLLRPLSSLRAERRAAVAAVLHLADPISLLLMVRAEHPCDPWSGHISFPGGRCEAQEAPLDAALRELFEELGFRLPHSSVLGRLDDLQAVAGRRIQPMVISPFVMACRESPSFQLDTSEVQSTLWVPLKDLINPEHRRTMEYSVNDQSKVLPCVHYDGRVIWGLTLRMIDQLLSLLPEGKAEFPESLRRLSSQSAESWMRGA